MTVSDGESDIEITPVPSRKRSRVLTEEPRPLSEVDDEDNSTDDSTSNDTALQLFNLGHLKELRNGEEDYEWDSRRQIALLAVHEIQDTDDTPFWILLATHLTYIQQIIGVQLAKNAGRYTAQALIKRMPDNKISEIKKKSTKPQQNEHVEMAAQH